jgi:hypothetical protein
MPLTHRDSGPAENVFSTRTLRPAGVEAETHRPRIDPSDADPKVKRAIRRYETLAKAQASNQVLQRALAKVEDARLDFQEKQAAKLIAARQATLEAQKAKARDRISRETVQRLSGFFATAVKIGRVHLTFTPGRALDAVTRQFCLVDATAAVQIGIRESQRMVSLAQQGLPVEQDTDHLVAELKSICHRSVESGDCQIEVVE